MQLCALVNFCLAFVTRKILTWRQQARSCFFSGAEGLHHACYLSTLLRLFCHSPCWWYPGRAQQSGSRSRWKSADSVIVTGCLGLKAIVTYCFRTEQSETCTLRFGFSEALTWLRPCLGFWKIEGGMWISTACFPSGIDIVAASSGNQGFALEHQRFGTQIISWYSPWWQLIDR